MTEERHAHQGLPELHLHDPEHSHGRATVARGALRFTVLLVLLLLLGLGRSLYARWEGDKALEARAADSAQLRVRVIQPKRDDSQGQLTLPGTLQGTLEAQIYARASGYLREWRKDIGSVVRKGEVLATLELPEVTRQVEEARANHELARSAYERWKRLRSEDAVSQQEMDEKTNAFRQTGAVLERLRQQLAFGQVVAPFDGVVTRRNVNVGDLVNAGNGGAAQALFSMAQTDRLHVYAYLPQDRAEQVRVGDEVQLLVAGRRDRPVKGRVTRNAGAIDAATRTLQLDISVPNPGRALLPGAYVDLVFALRAGDALSVPANTLLFGAAGPQVALVRDGKVERRKVLLGIDKGREVEVLSGLSPADRLIVNPPDSVADGQAVVVEAAKPPVRSDAAGKDR